MIELDIDLRSVGRPPNWAWVVLCLLVIIALAIWGAEMVSHNKLRELRQKHARLVEQAAMPALTPPPPVRPVAPYEASARVALVQAQAGWEPLLASLESMQIPRVTPVEIEVLASERQIRVVLEFPDLAALINYLDEINAGEEAVRWQLVQAQANVQTTTASVSNAAPLATIKADW